MGKGEEERDQIWRAQARIDEYAAKKGEEPFHHKQEGGSDLVDATMFIEHQTVLEDQYVYKSDAIGQTI